MVVEAARDAGIKNIVITHPEWWIVDMSVEDQARMVKDYNVILERCYAQNMGGGKYKSNLPSNLEIIKEVGYKNVMVDTDGGRLHAVPGGQWYPGGTRSLYDPYNPGRSAGH